MTNPLTLLPFFNKSKILVLLVFAICLLSQNGFAQLSFTTSDQNFQSDSRIISTEVIGHDKESIYTVRKNRKGFFIDKYNHELELKRSEELKLKDASMRNTGSNLSNKMPSGLGKNNDLEEIHLMEFFLHNNKEIISFYSKVNGDSLILESAKLNKRRLTFQNKKKILAIKLTNSTGLRGTFRFSISKDSSKVCIYFPQIEGRDDCIKYWIFNSDFKLQKKGSVPFKEDDTKEDLYIYCSLTNSGNCIFSLVEIKPFGTVRKKKKSDYIQLIAVNPKAKSVKKTVNKLFVSKDLQLVSMVIWLGNDDNTLLCSGFYSDISKKLIVGSFFMKLSVESLDIQLLKLNNFTEAQKRDFLLSKNPTAKEAEMKRDQKKIKRFQKGKALEIPKSFQSIKGLQDEDGSTYLIATSLEIYEPANGASRFNNGDFVTIKFNQNGDIDWITNADRRQNLFSPLISVPFVSKSDDGIRFFYHLRGKEYGYSNDRLYPTSFTIEKNGEFKGGPNEKLQLLHVGEISFPVFRIYEMSSHEILMFGLVYETGFLGSKNVGGKLFKFKWR